MGETDIEEEGTESEFSVEETEKSDALAAGAEEKAKPKWVQPHTWGQVSVTYASIGLLIYLFAVIAYYLSFTVSSFYFTPLYMFMFLVGVAFSLVGAGFGYSALIEKNGIMQGGLGAFFGTITVGLTLLVYVNILSPGRFEGLLTAYCLSMIITSVAVGVHFGLREARKEAVHKAPAKASA